MGSISIAKRNSRSNSRKVSVSGKALSSASYTCLHTKIDKSDGSEQENSFTMLESKPKDTKAVIDQRRNKREPSN